MRRFFFLVLFVMAAVVALWQFNFIKLPNISFNSSANQAQKLDADIFASLAAGDRAGLIQKIAEGANVNAVNEIGQTPLMVAASTSNDTQLLTSLIRAGANVNATTADGWTALMFAAKDTEALAVPYLLLNAGADPAARNAEGQSVTDLAGITVRASPLFRNLEKWVATGIDSNWPVGYIVPVEGATISSRSSHLPGAPRFYRNGTHEGFDFYSGVVSVPIVYGTPIVSVATGTVIRADHDYVELSLEEYDQIIAASKNSVITPPELLDKLRGRQVWIEHVGGFVSRYAHLSAIPEGVRVGAIAQQGQKIGETGNSGTSEAALGNQEGPHPHVEIWRANETYLGQGLDPDQIYALAAQVFGEKALPPYRE